MRWEVCVVEGMICHSCSGRKTRGLSPEPGGEGPAHYRPVEADEIQERWLQKLFDDEEPVICEACLGGTVGDADDWLQSLIDEHRDHHATTREAIQKVLEIIDNYKRDASNADAFEHAPEECMGDLEHYMPRDPDVRVELAFLDIVPVWLNLELLRMTPDRSPTPDPPEPDERLLRQNRLWGEYRSLLARLARIYGETRGR